MSIHRRSFGTVFLLSCFSMACGGKTASGAITPKPTSYAEAQGEKAPERDAQGQCFLPGRYADVLVVDMDPADRTDIESALSEGVLTVRYDCEGLRVVRDCHGPGDYGFSSVSLKEQVIQLSSADELRANLPISGGQFAAELGGELSSGKTLDVGLAMVGKLKSNRAVLGVGDLSGECEEATHFIRGVTVGAFAMQQGTRGKVAAAAKILTYSSGAKSETSEVRMQKDGDLAACRKAERLDAQPPEQCRALLRLELKKLVPGKTDADAVAIDVEECPKGTERVSGKCIVTNATNQTQCSDASPETCAKECESGQAKSCAKAAEMLVASDRLGDAVPYLARACEAGSLSACHNYGFAHYMGQGVPQDFEKARQLFTKVCDGGEPVGCSGLGLLYQEGQGVEKDAASAAKFYTLACNGGEMHYGCPFLGNLYETGTGVPQDLEKARVLYEKSCNAVGRNGCIFLKKMNEE